MKNWSKQMLQIFQKAETLVILPYNHDGKTFEEISPVSPVVYQGSLYIRGWKGKNTKWFIAALDQPAGWIALYGHRFKVTFEQPAADPDFDEGLSDAFWDKYKDSRVSAPHALISDRGVQATIRIRPRVTASAKAAVK